MRKQEYRVGTLKGYFKVFRISMLRSRILKSTASCRTCLRLDSYRKSQKNLAKARLICEYRVGESNP
jgi:hypothetical protein